MTTIVPAAPVSLYAVGYGWVDANGPLPNVGGPGEWVQTGAGMGRMKVILAASSVSDAEYRVGQLLEAWVETAVDPDDGDWVGRTFRVYEVAHAGEAYLRVIEEANDTAKEE